MVWMVMERERNGTRRSHRCLMFIGTHISSAHAARNSCIGKICIDCSVEQHNKSAESKRPGGKTNVHAGYAGE